MKINLKINLKFEKEGNQYIKIQESGDKTLKNILEILYSKNMINLRNLEFYYFIEHSENKKDELEDFENAINMDTTIKFLNYFELDVF